MAFFCLSLAVLGYARCGGALPDVQRQRPWYTAVASTFTAMLGKLRLAIWGGRISEGRGRPDTNPSKICCTAWTPCDESVAIS